ncbi:MAG TPA: haloacid dehalogenase type II [Candidatus Sulfotelmatobacter sp.]|jgi:2-haloacid dehalogenase|nr:haloacid dehalogenase type II [Candidatus Sulfotelmatobacter sp.]
MKDVSAVVFDAYGTLFNLNAMAELAQNLGDRAFVLNDLWRRKQLEYTWLRSLTGQHADFLQVTGEALDYAMEALGLHDPALRVRLVGAYLTPTAYPEASAVLETLKGAGLGRVILSNGAPAMLASGTAAAGLAPLLDAVLSVEKAGVFKPHPSVYDLACKQFGLPPGKIAFVSSNGWDVAGAAAFGFRVAWVNRAGLPRERLPSGPEAVIPDLSTLPALLGLI